MEARLGPLKLLNNLSIMKKILIISSLAVGAIYLLLNLPTVNVLGSASGVSTPDCTVSTISPVQVKTSASQILATSTSRAYARIELIKTATNVATSTPSISFSNGAKATLATGFQLSTTTPSIEFGLDTDFPYTGTVSGIATAGASTIVRVIQCNYR